ncbi:MAG: secondary thiamine-phosphate synthase enzyme YjbQ [Cyclobacteriaceae bacterium]
MIILQKEISLRPYQRGFHLITRELVDKFPEIRKIETGVLSILIKHTSAGITINENADPSVRMDMETFVNDLVPEKYPHFIHTYEGMDDMPAHIKCSLVGSNLTIPLSGGKLNLGIWQGIYLGEFRNNGGSRNFVLTIYGNETGSK